MAKGDKAAGSQRGGKQFEPKGARQRKTHPRSSSTPKGAGAKRKPPTVRAQPAQQASHTCDDDAERLAANTVVANHKNRTVVTTDSTNPSELTSVHWSHGDNSQKSPDKGEWTEVMPRNRQARWKGVVVKAKREDPEFEKAKVWPTVTGMKPTAECAVDYSIPRPRRWIISEYDQTMGMFDGAAVKVLEADKPWAPPLEISQNTNRTVEFVVNGSDKLRSRPTNSPGLVGPVTAVGDIDVALHDLTGKVTMAKEPRNKSRRRKVADRIEPPARASGSKRTFGHSIKKGLRIRLASIIRPKGNPALIGVVSALANGDLIDRSDAVGIDPNLPFLPTGEVTPGEVKLNWKSRRRKHNKPIRIPKLASVLVGELRCTHTFMPDTPDNRRLIADDASRRARAYKLNEDPAYKDLRSHDLYRVIVWASGLFWLPDDEQDNVNDISVVAREAGSSGSRDSSAKEFMGSRAS
jgi:hypothetical protein